MKNYINPEMEIVMIAVEDVIATSGINAPQEGDIGNPDANGIPW